MTVDVEHDNMAIPYIIIYDHMPAYKLTRLSAMCYCALYM